jgi:uncharacterized protein YciI
MKQYVIIAQDGKDEGAVDRRMQERPAHLAGARKLKEQGSFITGGAILDDNGTMRGSVMIVQFESEEGLKQWMSEEPYILNGVWTDIQVKPFRVADV